MSLREIQTDDIEALFAVRVATRENRYSRDELEALGITRESVAALLRTSCRGWLREDMGEVVGFGMGNRENGEVWVLAVLPEAEGRGIGAAILERIEAWLWAEGWGEIWLTTDVDPTLRAYGFYRRQGWHDREIKDGMRYMYKSKPAS